MILVPTKADLPETAVEMTQYGCEDTGIVYFYSKSHGWSELYQLANDLDDPLGKKLKKRFGVKR